MQLHLKRTETTGSIGAKRYDLFAQLELTPEEQERMRKSEPHKMFLWEDDTGGSQTRWRLCLIPGGILSLLFAVLLAALFGSAFMILALPITLLGWIPFTKLVFNQFRPSISVADILTGRTIRVHHDLGYTVSSAKGGTAHVTLSRYCNPYDRPVGFDEFDCGRVWGAGAPL